MIAGGPARCASLATLRWAQLVVWQAGCSIVSVGNSAGWLEARLRASLPTVAVQALAGTVTLAPVSAWWLKRWLLIWRRKVGQLWVASPDACRSRSKLIDPQRLRDGWVQLGCPVQLDLLSRAVLERVEVVPLRAGGAAGVCTLHTQALGSGVGR